MNNAGIMRNLQLGENQPLEDVTREIDIDLSGPIRMVQDSCRIFVDRRTR